MEPVPVYFQLKLARTHQACERSCSILNTPALGAPLQQSQLMLSTLLLSFQVSLLQLPGKVPAESLMIS